MALSQREVSTRTVPYSESSWPCISDYAVIGDCRSCALISKDGAVEWLCWPRFDSASVFAAILDRVRGGTWKIAPQKHDIIRTHRQYLGESNVLQTVFDCHKGSITITDAMPVMSEHARRSILTPDHELLRHVECTRGEVEMEAHFEPRLEYGACAARLRQIGSLGITFVDGDGVYYFRSSVPAEIQGGFAQASWTMSAGNTAQFSLTFSENAPVVLSPLGDWTKKRIEESTLLWCRWSRSSEYDGPYREAILRSALVLKLLIYAPSGAVIAAPTTSLPESIGSNLNWDYRFCWLRDASLTVRALLGLGFFEEAKAFIGWLLYATRLTQPELRVMYTVFGNEVPRERTLDHLSGYRGSRPVRIGNAARQQLQLDVYGEVIDAVAQYLYHRGPFSRKTQRVLAEIGNYVATNWDRPDQGIWEPRERPLPHTHSRVLCWTALDRLINLCKKGHIENIPIDDFCRERDRIANQIRNEAWNPKLNSYVSTLGGDDLDASLLLMSYYGFEAANSERMRNTHKAIRENLQANDHLLYRYRNNHQEGAFGISSFWEADYLALGGGTIAQAQQLFESILQYRNDVGLFAEEIDPNNGEALGNFPQAFTHIGLINAALSITERLKGEKQLAHREPSAEENKAS